MPSPRMYKNDNWNLYFLTLTVLDWIDIFTSDAYFRLLSDSFVFCSREKGLELYEFVFMTNHLHFIARAPEGGPGLDTLIRDFKRFTTEAVRYQLKKDNRHYLSDVISKSLQKKNGNSFQLWQNTNYPEVISSESFLHTKVGYIWQNPVQKGYVLRPEDWKWSSARQKIFDLPVGSGLYPEPQLSQISVVYLVQRLALNQHCGYLFHHEVVQDLSCLSSWVRV